MDRLAARAAEWGLEPDYYDARGTRRTVPEHALRRLLASLDSQDVVSPPSRAPTLVWRRGRSHAIDLGKSQGRADWRLTNAGREIASGTLRDGRLELPADVPLGVFHLAWSAPGEARREATLIVAPQTAYQLGDVAERGWLLAVQLYAVRSRRNWGHGDFTDLARLVRLAAEIGAAGVGLNPLHALFDDRPDAASPYSPNSRLFLNPLYIDLEAVPEFPGVAAAGLGDAVARLRNASLVGYGGIAEAKGRALRLAHRHFQAHPDPVRKADFEAFRAERGDALERFAAFETLRRRFRQVWWEWPDEWRRPDAMALGALRAEAADEVGFHEYVQWLADRQLAACRDEARRLNLPVGLYVDLAVGVEPGGADAWSEQGSIIPQAEVGAPPDLLNTAGQAWGVAAFNPRALEAEDFAPFARLLAAGMRHAGAIRLDHVLGLNRLYLIPFGCRSQDGAYVRYPLQALLAVTALESVRHRCLVVGEDLGTVPAELRDVLADWGVWSYRVMLFERRADGTYRRPDEYPRNALATFSTHDLPTFAGWRDGHDLRVKHDLGIDPGESDAERTAARALLADALRGVAPGGDGAPEFIDVARFLARTPTRLLAIELEDVLGLIDQPNIPGTVGEHPNWRRRLPVDVEDLAAHAGLRALATALRQEGRAVHATAAAPLVSSPIGSRPLSGEG
jgi:4-alpha-glucanotransferase